MASDFPAFLAYGFDDTESIEYPPGTAANEPAVVGDFVFYDTTDNTMDRCGTDPTIIAGLSEVISENHKLLTPDGKVPYRVINGPSARIGLASATTPTQAHVGDQYGITRNAAGHWLLDTGKTGGSARVLVRKVDIANGIFFCQVLNDQLQFAAIA